MFQNLVVCRWPIGSSALVKDDARLRALPLCRNRDSTLSLLGGRYSGPRRSWRPPEAYRRYESDEDQLLHGDFWRVRVSATRTFPIVAFATPPGFNSLRLACKVHSLVRVTRRAANGHKTRNHTRSQEDQQPKATTLPEDSRIPTARLSPQHQPARAVSKGSTKAHPKSPSTR
jgi:hypothetical protein